MKLHRLHRISFPGNPLNGDDDRRGRTADPGAEAELSDVRNDDPLVAADARPQAHRADVFRLDHVLLLYRRHCRDADPAAARDAERRLLQPDIYNRMFTMHGIVMVWFFLIPSIPTTLGNFLVPLMIGAHDLAFPRLNLGQLVRLQSVRAGAALCPDHGRRRYRLDFLHAVFDAVLQRLCLCRRDGRVHQRLFDDHDGAEFRRDDSSPARARHDLDAPAAVRLGDLCGQRRHAARDPGPGDDDLLLLAIERFSSVSASSIRRAAATRCCCSTCSGSTRIPPSTS